MRASRIRYQLECVAENDPFDRWQMKKISLGCVFLCLAANCFGQNQKPLCPRHIETPDYPAIAGTAHLAGKFTLTATGNSDGNVMHVEATTDSPRAQAHPLLQKYAIANMERWTFAKPPYAPYTQAIVYDYEFDASLPPSGGPHALPAITKVNFDLPDRVTILTNFPMID
jgi:hypothetical protein